MRLASNYVQVLVIKYCKVRLGPGIQVDKGSKRKTGKIAHHDSRTNLKRRKERKSGPPAHPTNTHHLVSIVNPVRQRTN
jgi:hypothetical protein